MVLAADIVLLLSITLSYILRDWVLLHVTTRVNISLISDYLIKLMKLLLRFYCTQRREDAKFKYLCVFAYLIVGYFLVIMPDT
jgi:ABC-type bacteriocin/lantibiotic exporter with double-glycine peptidase domain